jgi:hypothetical protein
MFRSAQPDRVSVFHRLIQVSGNSGQRYHGASLTTSSISLLKCKMRKGEPSGGAPLTSKKLTENCANRRRPEQVELMGRILEHDDMSFR